MQRSKDEEKTADQTSGMVPQHAFDQLSITGMGRNFYEFSHCLRDQFHAKAAIPPERSFHGTGIKELSCAECRGQLAEGKIQSLVIKDKEIDQTVAGVNPSPGKHHLSLDMNFE